jgi:hypothetical protein
VEEEMTDYLHEVVVMWLVLREIGPLRHRQRWQAQPLRWPLPFHAGNH